MKVGVQRLSLICPQEEINNQLDAASDKKERQHGKTEGPIQTFENNLPMDKEEYIEELADEISENQEMYCQDVEEINKRKVIVKVDNEGVEVIKYVKK